MNILLGLVSMIAGEQKPFGDRAVHVQENHRVRRRKPQLFIFKILDPCKILRPVFTGELTHLMDRVGGRVPGRQNQRPVLVILFPELFEGGIPIDRIKTPGGVGVYIVRVVRKLPCQIHPNQCRRRLLIIREGDEPYLPAHLPKRLGNPLALGRLSASVQSVDNDQLSHYLSSEVRIRSEAYGRDSIQSQKVCHSASL